MRRRPVDPRPVRVPLVAWRTPKVRAAPARRGVAQ